jgi:hypothetical protein
VLLADEDVGHGALLGDVLEGVLDRGAVICSVLAVALLLLWVRYHVLTNLVELEDVGLCAHLAQKALG